MKSFWQGLRPDRLAGQIAILVLVSVVVFHFGVTIAFNLLREERWSASRSASVETAAGVALAVDLAPVADRPALLAELAPISRGLALALVERSPGAEAARGEATARALRSRLWPSAEVHATGGEGAVAVAVALRKGGYLTIAFRRGDRGPDAFGEGGPRGPGPGGPARWADGPPFPPGGGPAPGPIQPTPALWAGPALFFLICAAILTLWTSSAVVAPLVELARQAETFPSESGERELIVEQGPREVRDLTRALNRMQDRIYTMIAARSRTLAAISHDLRTIITRMRLRAEFVEDETLRAKMLHDVDLMDAMLYKNLLYLREERHRHARDVVDLDSLLQTVADQFADLGHEVSYAGGERQMAFGSPTDLQRVFSNLVENAVAHAERVTLSIARVSPEAIRVDVADDGPGIADADKEKVVEPFMRGRPGRNLNEHGGFGLGLSIVRALVEEAGGSLQLLDRAPHGLVARVTLRAADPPAA